MISEHRLICYRYEKIRKKNFLLFCHCLRFFILQIRKWKWDGVVHSNKNQNTRRYAETITWIKNLSTFTEAKMISLTVPESRKRKWNEIRGYDRNEKTKGWETNNKWWQILPKQFLYERQIDGKCKQCHQRLPGYKNKCLLI